MMLTSHRIISGVSVIFLFSLFCTSGVDNGTDVQTQLSASEDLMWLFKIVDPD
jgi:hypothetical protein